MSGEQQALRNYRERRPGWYVVNCRTDIAVAYFKDQERAEAEAERRNTSLQITPNLLIAKQVHQDVDF